MLLLMQKNVKTIFNLKNGARHLNLAMYLFPIVELAWRSGSINNYHATVRGSIPGENGVKTDLHILRKGQ